MGSLLLDSFNFLGQQLQVAQDNRPDAFDSLRQRAFCYRQYARSSSLKEDVIIDSPSETNEDAVEISGEFTKIEADIIEPTPSTSGTNFAEHAARSLPPIPDIPGVDREILTNLLMSWFYAGYYTGLAEGKFKSDS